jgi:hypothetical protein
MMIRSKILLGTVLGLVLCGPAANAQDAPGALFAVSDGKGHVSLLWFPPASKWPAGGWRLSDSTGKVLVPQIKMGDPAALDALSVEDRDAIQKLPPVLASPDTSAKHRQLINILGLRAFSEPPYARAMGLAWTLDSVAPGSRTYRVEGLDAGGQTTVTLTSIAVDSSQATAPPPLPGDVQAKVDQSGVSLVWTPVPENRQLPVIAYAIERDGGGQSNAAVTAKPVIVGSTWDPKKPLVLDRNAPPNDMLTYRVFSVDVFGRRSSSGSAIKIFFPDFRALEPPDPVTATADAGKIIVNWKTEKNPNRAGFLIERSMLAEGPYEALSAQPLGPDVNQYEDDAVRGGSTYYYRLRSLNSRGDLGNPSTAAVAQPRNPGGPPKVEGVAADAGQTRVRLTWKPVSFPVAGYFVERHALTGAAATQNWVRLNAQVSPEPLYDDYIGLSSDVKLEYRVLAVAFDNAEGPPSAPVQVVIEDRSVPSEPSITGASGGDGKASFTFVPASPEEKSAQFLVLRSGSAGELGVVIGDPVPGSARDYTDLYVSPGETYWYRLVAVDKNGNRSDPTRPVVIRVGSPTIPKPATPSVQFVASPYPHVVLQFQSAPSGMSAIVERQEQPTAGWLRIAGPMQTATASDNNPASTGKAAYRVSYVSGDGKVGPPSDLVNAPAVPSAQH